MQTDFLLKVHYFYILFCCTAFRVNATSFFAENRKQVALGDHYIIGFSITITAILLISHNNAVGSGMNVKIAVPMFLAPV